ncbi:MAG: VPLPA-CTERM-specific exosortase XrtD [Endozoicomonadaceae bacterium]|nr:VPLPA-CTERM-specific exosortase XrtD [Endozoicomonadaceae bacterium]
MEPRYWFLFIISGLLLLVAFWGGIHELTSRWDKQEEYSHGYIIPLITLYFIWLKKDTLKQTEFSPSWFGLVIVSLSLIVFLIGEVSALFILIHYALIATLVGMAWAIMGWPAVKQVLLPILLLIFAIPLPYFLEASLSANLQLLSSKLGVTFIRWCQIPVYLEGNVIDLGLYKLQVVEACSGLRYMFPLMSLGFICAYMFDTVFWKRVVIFISTIPITIIMNSFRIGMIGVLVDNYGISVADGFLHDFEGWIIFMACLGLLIVEMMLLTKIGGDGRPMSEVFGLISEQASNGKTDVIKNRSISYPFVASTILLVAVVIGVYSIDQRSEFIPDRKAFPSFPMEIAEWTGKHSNMENAVVNRLGLSDYILADFIKDSNKPVNLYVAYYQSQRKGVSPHSPRVCIPGGGWQITDIKRTNLRDLPVNRIIIKKDEMTQLVYYWFQQRGRKMANEYLMKWFLFKDALFLNRTDGALVRLTTLVFPGESMDDAEKRIHGLAADLLPALPAYIPE